MAISACYTKSYDQDAVSLENHTLPTFYTLSAPDYILPHYLGDLSKFGGMSTLKN